jgi:hypothetical protein
LREISLCRAGDCFVAKSAPRNDKSSQVFMNASRKRLLIILLAVAIALWIAGVVAGPIVDGLDAKTKADNTILRGIPFILNFIGIIVAFVDFIIFMATRLNNNISESIYRPIERALIAGIVLGVIGMFQPFTVVLYTIGFIVLLVSTIGYIFWSHIIPRMRIDRATHHEEGLGTVSVAQVEQKQVEG